MYLHYLPPVNSEIASFISVFKTDLKPDFSEVVELRYLSIKIAPPTAIPIAGERAAAVAKEAPKTAVNPIPAVIVPAIPKTVANFAVSSADLIG